MCDSKKHNLQLAYKLAHEKLSGMDIKQQCLRSGAQYVQPDKVTMEYLNQIYVISIPSMEISLDDTLNNREDVNLKDKILMLHYLITAKGTPATGKLIGLKQVPGGLIEYTNFSREVLTPLVDHFGGEPEQLVQAADTLKGSKTVYGDVSVRIKTFPNVSVVIVLWRGDDEFAPNANILFDSTIIDYLATEDISVLCERIIEKLTESGQNGE